MRIGMIAGEPSGDVLAAGIIRELKQLYPDAIFEGIGGKHMLAEGFDTKFDMESLSVMGLVEVLKHLPTLLKIRKSIVEHFTQNPPDVFIGIDAPDFNLPVETQLKRSGVKTVHYVAPTVWAWRESRIHKIAKATNLVLGIFPFEKPIFDKYKVAYQYVGHTMADSIDVSPNFAVERDEFGLNKEQKVLALLPGSRSKEVATLLPIFLQTAALLNQQFSDLKILIPAANQARYQQIKSVLTASFASSEISQLDIEITQQSARKVMLAADVILLASGTASLEAMLCKKPMVVAYQMPWLTYKMMQRLYKPEYFALPNILAEKELVPELLQDAVNPSNMARLLSDFFSSQYQEHDLPKLIDNFDNIHCRLKLDADKQSALAIQSLIESVPSA